MSGIMDFLSKVGQPATGGIMSPPSPWQNRIGLFGSTLKDVGADLSGRPQDANNIAGFYQGQQQQGAMAQQQQARTALQQALATNDPSKIKAAALAFAAAGGDVAGLATALKFGRPEVQNLGDGTLASIDPFSGQASIALQGPRKPLINGGMTSMDNGVTWKPIPGYVDQQGSIQDARAAGTAAHRAPPKPTTAAANPFGLTPPWQQFGGK